MHIGVRPTFGAAICRSGFEEIFFSDPSLTRAVTETGHWWVSGVVVVVAPPQKVLRLLLVLAERHWNCRLRLALIKWIVDFSPTPQPMQQHGQLSRHSDRRSLLSVLASSPRQFQPPAPYNSRAISFGPPDIRSSSARTSSRVSTSGSRAGFLARTTPSMRSRSRPVPLGRETGWQTGLGS